MYLVTSVTGAEEIHFAGQLVDDYTAANYTIYRPYHPERADWPINVQNWGNELLCQAVIPRAPVDQNKFAGPFYSGVNSVDPSESFVDITPDFITARQEKSSQASGKFTLSTWSICPIRKIAEDGGTPNTFVIIGTAFNFQQSFYDGEPIDSPDPAHSCITRLHLLRIRQT